MSTNRCSRTVRFLVVTSFILPVVSAAPVNLALHRSAYQSSTLGNYSASFGVDGFKYDTSLFQTQEENGPWWEVDLGGVSAIDNVTLYNRVECCQENVRGVQVLLSTNGSDYQLIYSHNNSVFRNRRVEAGGLSARFVRVQLPYRGSLQLQEVEVYQYGTWNPPSQPIRWTPVRISRGSAGSVSSSPSAGSSSVVTGAATIEGRWSVSFNGIPGSMDIRRSGNGWTATLNLDAGPEPLANVSFDSRTGAVSFVRTSVNQHYTGTLAGNNMRGRFDNISPWSATRQGVAPATTLAPPVSRPVSPPPPSVPVSRPPATSQPVVSAGSATIEGRWSVDFSGYKGTMEFARTGGGWTGRLNLDAGPESLSNIAFDARTGAISFVRPSAGQHYVGTLSGNNMRGRFDNSMNWTATRQGSAPVASSPASGGLTIQGRWSVDFSGYKGTMEFSRSGSGWAGRLNLDAGLEPLSNITFNATTGAISFIRQSVGQHYTGTVTGNNMRGRFDTFSTWTASR